MNKLTPHGLNTCIFTEAPFTDADHVNIMFVLVKYTVLANITQSIIIRPTYANPKSNISSELFLLVGAQLALNLVVALAFNVN